jgi:hypothetical protein
MSFYELILVMHDITRWLVLVIGIYAVVRAFLGWLGKKPWVKADRSAGVSFTSIIDIQVLLGLVLYFVSPITTGGLRNFGDAMKVADVRFFLVEHSLIMLAAAVIAHIGSARVKKAATDLQKHRLAALWYLGALVLILTFIPWNRLFS